MGTGYPMIFDAHLHLPWQEEYPMPEAKLAHLLKMMEKNGISGALVIADSLSESSIGTNEQVLEVVKGHRNIFVAAGFSPLVESEKGLEQIDGWLKEGLIKAVKLYTVHEDFFINDPRLAPVIQLCVRYGVPLMFHSDTASGECSEYCAVERVIRLAEANPELTIVCCHCWFPKMRENWLKVRHLKNIVFDLSSFYMDEKWRKIYPEAPYVPFTEAVSMVQEMVEFNPDILIYGSDFASLTMEDHIRMINEAITDFETREKIFWKNASRIYRLGL